MSAALAVVEEISEAAVETGATSMETVVTPALSAEVLALIQPIGITGTGADPRYTDQFSQIKKEIDQLSGANFELVYKLSREVLISEGKDLRVAGYLIMSTLYCKGISKLPEAITVYRMIMDKLWEGCFPLKESARETAYAWLNSDRMDTFIQQQNGEESSLADLQRLRVEIDLLNKTARHRMGDEVPQWTRLNSWVDSFLKVKLAEASNQEQVERDQTKKLTEARSDSAASDAPLTESRAEQLMGKIISFYRERGERAQSVALSRALRWGGLSTPPNEAGVTRIPPFRTTAMNEISSLQSSGADLDQIFVACENLLMEPGGQWNMDLQHVVHKTLVGLNDSASTLILEGEIKSLIKRCNGMINMCYDGRMPFANEATKEWLSSLAEDSSGQGGESDITADSDTKEITIKASKACAGGNLVAGLEILKELQSNNGRQKFIRRMEEARLCVTMKYTEMARPMLEALEREMVKTDLSTWEPRLAISVWNLHLKLIFLELPKADSTQKTALISLEKEINASICMADLYEAARIRTTKIKGVNHG